MFKRKGKVSLFGRFIAVVMTAILLVTVVPVEVKAATIRFRIQFLGTSSIDLDLYVNLFYFKDVTNDKIYTFKKDTNNMIIIEDLTQGIDMEVYLQNGILQYKGVLQTNTTWGTYLTTINFYDGGTCLDTVYTTDTREIKQERVENPRKEGYTFTGWKDEDGRDVTFPIYVGVTDKLLQATVKKGDIYNVYATWNEHKHQWNVDEWNYDKDAHWHECIVDGCPIIENTEKEGYTGHEMGEWTVVNEAQFRDDGLKVRECQTCDYKEEEIIPKLSDSHIHDFSGREEVAKDPKCYESGLKYVYCTLEECGAYEEREIAVVPHDYEDEWRYSDVVHYHKCKDCDAICDEEAHQMTEWQVVDGQTYGLKDLQERHCTICEYSEERLVDKPIPEHKHEYTGRYEITKEPTCISFGIKYIYCNDVECEYFIEESIPKLDHDYEVGWLYNEDIHYHKCKNCDHHIDDEEHNMVETNMVKLATKDSPGIMEVECVSCGYIEYEEVPYDNPKDDSNNDSSDNNPNELVGSKPSGDAGNEGELPPFTAPQTGDMKLVHIYATVAMIAGMTYLLYYFKPIDVSMTEETKKKLVDKLIKWAKSRNGFIKTVALIGISIVLFYYHFMKHLIKLESVPDKATKILQ